MQPTQNQAEPVEVTPAFILRGAATYLDRHGWTQENYYFNPIADEDLFPAACALGAIGMAAYGHQTEVPDASEELPTWPEFRAAYIVLRAYVFGTDDPSDVDGVYLTIGDWNDAVDQKMEAVIDTLTAAADEWDRIHGGAA